METTAAFSGLTCTDCGRRFDADAAGLCPDCNGIREPVYDEPTAGVPLPFPSETLFTAGEGDTPLVRTDRLAEELGVERAFVKDESRNPTGTVVDRGMAVAVTAAVRADAEPVALAAAGNAAQSAAAYAGRADLRSYAFVPSRTAFSNKAMVNVHGGEMRVVGGRYDDARAAIDDQLAADYAPLGAFRTPYRHDACKTVLYETLADFTAAVRGADSSVSTSDPTTESDDGTAGSGDTTTESDEASAASGGDTTADSEKLAVPDTLVVPVGTGELLVGVQRGLRELADAGRIETRPTIVAAQPSGCAPIVRAHEAGAEPEPWETPDTIVGELEIPDPTGGRLAVAALDDADGVGITIDDDDALETAVTVAQTEVLEVGGAGGVALAAAWELADRGALGDSVVVVNPDAGVKTPDVLRSHLMGRGV